MPEPTLRSLTPADAPWVRAFWTEHWGGETMVVHGDVYNAASLDGYVAENDGQLLGLVTYRLDGDSCEVMSLDSLVVGQGIGTRLLESVLQAARDAGCRRLYLSTTNDNLNALRFYQRRGLRLCGLRAGAVEEARKIKPGISLVGNFGIPIRDELELEKYL